MLHVSVVGELLVAGKGGQGCASALVLWFRGVYLMVMVVFSFLLVFHYMLPRLPVVVFRQPTHVVEGQQ